MVSLSSGLLMLQLMLLLVLVVVADVDHHAAFSEHLARAQELHAREQERPAAGRLYPAALVEYELALDSLGRWREAERRRSKVGDKLNLQIGEEKKSQEKGSDNDNDNSQDRNNLHDRLIGVAEEFEVMKNVGMLFLSWGNPRLALTKLMKAKELAPSDKFRAEVLEQISIAFLAAGEGPEKSLEALLEAINLDPYNAIALQRFASIEEKDFDECVTKMNVKPPRRLQTYKEHSNWILNLTTSISKKFDLLSSHGGIENLILDLSRLHFASFEILDRENNSQEAWKHLSRANALMKSKEASFARYDKEKAELSAQKVISVFQEQFFVQNTQGFIPENGMNAIFIIGLPRSGSTLLEQMLNAHSKITGRGENSVLNSMLPEIRSEIMKHISDPKELARSIRNWGERILNQMVLGSELDPEHSRDETKKVAVDKMLFNFMNVGFIQLLLPKANIIHVYKSDARDAVYSLYKRQFYLGTAPWSYDLEEIVSYYKGVYIPVMRHWDKVLPKKVIHVKYEDLVGKTEETLRKVFQSCGLKFEEGILNRYSSLPNPSSVLTSSAHQVRKPLFSQSIGAWKKYRAFLEPPFTKLSFSSQELARHINIDELPKTEL